MTQTSLSQRVEQVFIDDALIPGWDSANVVGYDLNASPGDADFIPLGESLDEVGETYPSLTVSRTNETSPGGTGYNFITNNGAGQDRFGQLLATAYAEKTEDGYTGDSNQHSAIDANALVNALIDEVERTCLVNQTTQDTEFHYLGSYRGADAPNDYDATPAAMIEQCLVLYSWPRLP